MLGFCLKQTNHVMHKPELLVGSAGSNLWLISKNMFSLSKGKQVSASKFTSFSELLKKENEKTLKDSPLAAANESLNQFSNVKMKFHNFSQNNAAERSPFSQPCNADSTSYLQPSKTGFSITKLAKKLGFDQMRDVANEDINRPRVKPTRSYIRDRKMENIEEEKPAVNEKPAQDAKQEEAENIQLVRARKSKEKTPQTMIQQLMLKQKGVYGEPERESIVQRNLLKRRENRTMNVNVREYHTSTMMFASKSNNKNGKNNKNSKNSNNKKNNKDDCDDDDEDKGELVYEKVCSGCFGVKEAFEKHGKPLSKTFLSKKCLSRGVGKCRQYVPPGVKIPYPFQKCKTIHVGRCRERRLKPPEVKFTYGFKCYEQNDPKRKLTKRKYHSSTNSTDTGLIPEVDKTGLEVSDLCANTKSKISKTDIQL